MRPRYGYQGPYIQGLDIRRETPECPTCGEHLGDCDHSVHPEPEHLPRVPGWGADPNQTKYPPHPDDHLF